MNWSVHIFTRGNGRWQQSFRFIALHYADIKKKEWAGADLGGL